MTAGFTHPFLWAIAALIQFQEFRIIWSIRCTESSSRGPLYADGFEELLAIEVCLHDARDVLINSDLAIPVTAFPPVEVAIDIAHS